jgi:hypothetical protein
VSEGCDVFCSQIRLRDEFGPVPTGLTEDRYIKSVEVKEVRLLDADTKARLSDQVRRGSGYGRFRFTNWGSLTLSLPMSADTDETHLLGTRSRSTWLRPSHVCQ